MSEIVCPPDFEDRLDRALAALCNGLSRTRARQLIAAGAVFIDGRRCRIASQPVRPGERLRVESLPSPTALKAAPLEVLFEAQGCIAISKPAGMPSTPTRQGALGTALDVLRQQLRQRTSTTARVWAVHRLDTGTSGALLFATTRAAAAHLSAAFQRGDVSKVYLAQVCGQLEQDQGEISLPIRVAGRRAEIASDGRPAVTRWELVRRDSATTLVRLRPLTGRMHQLRVHFQAIGNPIVGDRTYGAPAAPRLMLHAETLSFPTPDGQTAVVHAAPPAELE